MNTDQIFAALCVWEWMVLAQAGMLESDYDGEEFRAVYEEKGTHEMRYLSMQVGREVDGAWRKLSANEQNNAEPFDWAFVPSFCESYDWPNV